MLSEKGAPTPVAWTRMRAPRSLMDTIGADAIAAAAKASPLQAKYGQTVDRESAYERLTAKLAPPPEAPAAACRPAAGAVADRGAADARAGRAGRARHLRQDDGAARRSRARCARRAP